MHATPTSETVCIEAFSKVSASISHEIKNTMAIINENAGLLDDLVVMGDGENVSSERVKSASDSIVRQVQRANAMMNRLNRFAHSADYETGTENLHDILSLIVSLTVRQAAAKNLEINTQCPENEQIHTRLLPFHALVYLTLRLLIDHSDDGDTLAVKGALKDGVISVNFTAPSISAPFMTSFSENQLKVLIAELKVEHRCEKNSLCLEIPPVTP
jgi:signal transduction histidine kinase